MAETVGFATLCFHPKRILKIQSLEGGVEDMDAHVTERTATEVDELAPLSGVINLADVIMNGRGAQPKVPVQRIRFFGFLLEGFAIVSPCLEGPDVYFADLAENSLTQVVTSQAVGFPGLILDSHLRGQSLFLGELREVPGFG